MRRLLLTKAPPRELAGEFLDGRHSELVPETGDVSVNGAKRDTELTGDLCSAVAPCHEMDQWQIGRRDALFDWRVR